MIQLILNATKMSSSGRESALTNIPWAFRNLTIIQGRKIMIQLTLDATLA